MDRNKVVLVDENDLALGEMNKLEAHKKGKLHRAFSVFIFNNNNEMLLHQRADKKYHGAGLWTNACCSHPQMSEDIKESASERLYYEMGLKCELTKLFSFVYKKAVENDLIEHEFDHVFIGFTNESPKPNNDEVKTYKWAEPEWLQSDIKSNPNSYTSWFKMALPKVLVHLKETV